MSINSDAVRRAGPFSGDGVTTVFPFTFKVFATTDVLVVRTSITGVETAISVGYSVLLNADQDVSPGGTVTIVPAPIIGELITLGSKVEATQKVTLTNLGKFYPEVLNDAFDRVTILVQQLKEEIGRCIKVGMSTTGDATPSSLMSALNAAVVYVTSTVAGLASQFGASLVGFIQSGVGAVVRTIQDKLRETVSVADFGAVGDGIADDTAALNAAFARGGGRVVDIPAGVYLVTTVSVYPNTVIRGVDGATVIKAKLTLASNMPLLRNVNAGIGGVDVYTDQNIRVEGVTFDGNGLGARTAELVGISKARRVRWEKCRFTNVRYIGLAHAACRGVRIVNCAFDSIGEPTPQPVAGPAVWFGSAPDGSKNYDVAIIGNTIEDCNEAGINCGADRVRIVGNEIRNVKEAGIFIASSHRDIQIVANTIATVGKNNISSSGIECGASNVVILGNQISDINGGCIALTDAQGVTVSGNVLKNPRRDAAGFPGASHIEIISTQAAPNQPRWITITGNTAISFGPDAYAFIYGGNAGAAIQDVLIQGNNCAENAFASGMAIKWDAGKRGTDVVTRGNIGASDVDYAVGEFQSRGTPGTQSITGMGFKPRRLEIQAIKAGASVEVSESWCSAPGAGVCHYYAVDGANRVGSTAGAKAVNLVSPSGVNDVVATLVSYDDDGFTLSFTTTAFQAWVMWRAYA